MKRLTIGLGLPALVLAMLLVVLGSVSEVRPARAATGDLAGSVTFNTDCTNGAGPLGTNVGVGIAFDGTNLWYSCVFQTTDLYRANPTTGVVDASYDIAGGLGALSYDATRNVIWAGAGNGDVLKIALDAGKNVTGSSLAFNVAGVVGNCGLDDGLAFDARDVSNPNDDRIYYSDDCFTTTIRTFDLSGNLDESFAWGGSGCYNSGLAVGGSLLFQGSDGCSHVWVVDKGSKAASFDFSTAIPSDPNFRDEDLECDTSTFAGKDVMWSKEAYSPMRAHAFEIPAGTCGVGGQPANPAIAKTPRLSNLWLCQPVATCADPRSGIGERDLPVVLFQPITSISPKGEPQTIGSFEFEVRYDAKFVSVQVVPGPLLADADVTLGCATTPTQNSVQFRCNVKGKSGEPIVGPGILAIVRVRPTSDVYSMLIPNQDNGIATQLINQGCQLSDLQGHPIKTAVCGDAELTIRYLEGDLNADCVVNVQDQQLIAYRWGSRVGSLLYNSRYDLEPAAPKKGDGDIDAKDLQVVFGRHTSPNSTCAEPWPAQLPVDPKALPTPTPVDHNGV